MTFTIVIYATFGPAAPRLMDFAIKKNLMFTERFSMEFGATFTNVFNHDQLNDPYNALTDTADFGALGYSVGQANNPRHVELSLRVRF